jgi:hypothetical protein
MAIGLAFVAAEMERLAVSVPPDVYAPLPVEPLSEKHVVLMTVMIQVPFAAVLPPTPETTTACPVANP